MSEFLFLEDLNAGESWKSPARTVTETDIVSFAGLTGDYDPLHVDHDYAAQTPYGKPIAHGLLGLSMMAGLSSSCPRVRTLALTNVEEWQFLKPLYIGDTVHAVTEVESVTPRGRRSGVVVWRRSLVNQRGETVQAGTITTLVSRRSFKSQTQSEPNMVKLGQLRSVAAQRMDVAAKQ